MVTGRFAAGAAVASVAFGFGATAQERQRVLGLWVPAAHAVPDPLPLTDAARRALTAAEPAAHDDVLAPEPLAPDDVPTAEPAAAEPAATEPAATEPPSPCAAPGIPALLDTHDAVEITQQGDRIRLRYTEWSDAARTVYMNPRNGPPTQEPSPLGVSFGRWEMQTLAIFTTYIAYPYFDRARTPQSAAVTVLERYTPSADGTRLEWKVTVTDAATFTAPVVITGAMSARTSTAPPLVASNCVG